MKNTSGNRNTRANAKVAGGGGGGWAAFNEDRARSRLTFVRGSRDTANLDPVSAAILEVAGGGTSIFDPVLCELAYRWLCPPGGLVLDPFAGGSVRGIVASHLGRRYLGVELRPEQAAANDAQLSIAKEPLPEWRIGDARDVEKICADAQADFLFSCPPYGDLEVYSDDPRDLSTMPFAGFLEAYNAIVLASCRLLKGDRFACFVVGDFRDKAGFYRNFPGLTVAAFEAAGLRLYNEAILVTAAGSLPVRARKQFQTSRKLGKTHQNVLVFVKGDPKKAASAIGKVDFGSGEAIVQNDGSDPALKYGEVM